MTTTTTRRRRSRRLLLPPPPPSPPSPPPQKRASPFLTFRRRYLRSDAPRAYPLHQYEAQRRHGFPSRGKLTPKNANSLDAYVDSGSDGETLRYCKFRHLVQFLDDPRKRPLDDDDAVSLVLEGCAEFGVRHGELWELRKRDTGGRRFVEDYLRSSTRYETDEFARAAVGIPCSSLSCRECVKVRRFRPTARFCS